MIEIHLIKKWDRAYGGIVGAVGGEIAGERIGKLIEEDGRFDRPMTSMDINDRYDSRTTRSTILGNLNRKYRKFLNKRILRKADFETNTEDENLEKKLKAIAKANRDAANDEIKALGKMAKRGRHRMKKARFALPLAVAGTVGGYALGSNYGRDNDLRRQRKKAEDAIGDHVADSLRKKDSNDK